MTIVEVLDRVREVMAELGIKDHLPTHAQLMDLGKISGQNLQKAGNLKGISMLMGLPMAPKDPRKVKPAGIYKMEDVKPSQAFKKQMESGKLYKELQTADTIKEFATIDLSQFEGMQSYAERVKYE